MGEQDYMDGTRSVWRELLQLALANLGYEETSAQSWIVEREQIIASLRQLCADHGDNDWSEDLNLADVMDKHLAPYLDEPGE